MKSNQTIAISFRSKCLVAAPVFLIALGLRLWILRSGLFYDDGMIVLRVSRNLANGAGFGYNAGDHVQAATSLLWTFFSALAWKVFPGSPFLAMRTTGVLLDSLAAAGLALVLLAGSWWRNQQDGNSADRILSALIAGLVYASASTSAIGAPSGLETGLYTCLIVAGFLALITSHFRLAVALSLLLVLVRPDGVLVAGTFATYLFFYDRRAFGFAAIAYVVGGSLYLLGTYAYFHGVLPQTILAKELFRRSASTEWSIIIHHFFLGVATPTGLVALVGIFEMVRTRPAFSILPLWCAVYVVCFATFGDWWPWYLPPVVLGYAVCVGVGFEVVLRTFARAIDGARLLRPVGVSLGVLLAAALTVFTLRKIPAMSQAQDLRWKRGQQVAALLTKVSSSSDTIMLEPLGIIGFYTPRTFYDYPGLASPRISAVLRTLHEEVSKVPDEPSVVKVLLSDIKPNLLVLRQEEYETDEAGNALSSCHLFATVPVPTAGRLPDLASYCGDCDATMYLLRCDSAS